MNNPGGTGGGCCARQLLYTLSQLSPDNPWRLVDCSPHFTAGETDQGPVSEKLQPTEPASGSRGI